MAVEILNKTYFSPLQMLQALSGSPPEGKTAQETLDWLDSLPPIGEDGREIGDQTDIAAHMQDPYTKPTVWDPGPDAHRLRLEEAKLRTIGVPDAAVTRRERIRDTRKKRQVV